jgi:ABC-2 type transport system permease protein
MDATATPPKPVTYNRWLPYWAVFQADVHQTMRSWVYRVWVLMSLLGVGGYLFYRLGLYRGAGLHDDHSVYLTDLIRVLVVGSMTLVVVLSASSISGERGTLADSVLSRGISRYQYFLGKWHARVAAVLGTFFLLMLTAVLCAHFLLHEELHLLGCLVAVGTVSALLGAVATGGVAVSALTNNTMVGIAVLWVVLFGGSFALALLPGGMLPSPDRVLRTLPYMLQGHYDSHFLRELIGYAALGSGVLALVGMLYFSRRDV